MKYTLIFTAINIIIFLGLFYWIKATGSTAPHWVDTGMKVMGWAVIMTAVLFDQTPGAVALAFFVGAFNALYPALTGFLLCLGTVALWGIVTGNM